MTAILPLPHAQGDGPAAPTPVALPDVLARTVPPGGTVLLLGPGPGAPVVGEDVTVHHHVGPAARLPLADASADGAWAPLALDQLARGDAVLAVRELHRVLRADAWLVVTADAAVWGEADLGTVLFAAGFGVDAVGAGPGVDGGSVVVVHAHA